MTKRKGASRNSTIISKIRKISTSDQEMNDNVSIGNSYFGLKTFFWVGC